MTRFIVGIDLGTTNTVVAYAEKSAGPDAVPAIFEIEQLVALAVLMPIVASMGGNAGTQSLTVALRALATKDLTGSNVWRVIRREVAVGLVNGLAFALIMGIIGVVWFGLPMLGVELTGQAAKQVNVYAGNLFIRNGFIASLTEFEREMRG